MLVAVALVVALIGFRHARRRMAIQDRAARQEVRSIVLLRRSVSEWTEESLRAAVEAFAGRVIAIERRRSEDPSITMTKLSLERGQPILVIEADGPHPAVVAQQTAANSDRFSRSAGERFIGAKHHAWSSIDRMPRAPESGLAKWFGRPRGALIDEPSMATLGKIASHLAMQEPGSVLAVTRLEPEGVRQPVSASDEVLGSLQHGKIEAVFPA